MMKIGFILHSKRQTVRLAYAKRTVWHLECNINPIFIILKKFHEK